MDKPKKSVAVSLVVTNTWAWRPQLKKQGMVVPVQPNSVGTVLNLSCQWGCAALTLALSRVQRAPAGLVVPAPSAAQRGLVDRFGGAL